MMGPASVHLCVCVCGGGGGVYFSLGQFCVGWDLGRWYFMECLQGCH